MPDNDYVLALTDIVIDSEFKYLLPSLDSVSLTVLEEDILEHGLRDALVLWRDSSQENQSILIDGHNRYEILLKHDLPFKVSYMEFDSREEVIIWIITTQIARRNLAALQMSYYRGTHYMTDKRLVGENQFMQVDRVVQTEQPSGSTAVRLAEKYKVSPMTIRRDAQVALGIDALGAISSLAKRMILEGEVPIPRTRLQVLATADIELVREIALSIEEGTFERRPVVDDGQAPSLGERPASIQAFNQLSTSIRRNYNRELRQLTGGDLNADPKAAKPALRAYIESLEELYGQL